MIDELFGNWLAGFIDGEGCFSCTLHRGSLNFRFKISLRADDVEVLNYIKNNLGCGKVVFEGHIRKSIPKMHPQYKFTLYSREDRQKLIDLLEVCPLRSKKKKDFEVWRQLHFLDKHSENKNILVNRLKEVRQYSMN